VDFRRDAGGSGHHFLGLAPFRIPHTGS